MDKMTFFKQAFAFVTVVFLLSLSSCKSFNKVIGEFSKEDLSADELLDSVAKNVFEYDNVYFKRVFVEIELDGKKQSSRANIYIQKDSSIVISFIPLMGIELYRAKLSKDGLIILDRMNRNVIRTDYKAFSERYLIDLEYSQFESLLTNRVFTYPLNNIKLLNRYSTSNKDSIYSFSSFNKSVSRGTQSFQEINIIPGIYKPLNNVIKSPERNISFQVNYSDFVALNNNSSFPLYISIQGVKGKDYVKVNFNFSSVEVNSEQFISFSIPPSYANKTL